jgi:hypothetical protein
MTTVCVAVSGSLRPRPPAIAVHSTRLMCIIGVYFLCNQLAKYTLMEMMNAGRHTKALVVSL